MHVQHATGEAKVWIEPVVALHASYGLKPKHVAEALKIVMEPMGVASQLEREWMAQWRRSTVALARVRADELSRLTPADALAASDALLAIGATVPLPVERLVWSGLIEFQRSLHQRR